MIAEIGTARKHKKAPPSKGGLPPIGSMCETIPPSCLTASHLLLHKGGLDKLECCVPPCTGEASIRGDARATSFWSRAADPHKGGLGLDCRLTQQWELSAEFYSN